MKFRSWHFGLLPVILAIPFVCWYIQLQIVDYGGYGSIIPALIVILLVISSLIATPIIAIFSKKQKENEYDIDVNKLKSVKAEADSKTSMELTQGGDNHILHTIIISFVLIISTLLQYLNFIIYGISGIFGLCSFLIIGYFINFIIVVIYTKLVPIFKENIYLTFKQKSRMFIIIVFIMSGMSFFAAMLPHTGYLHYVVNYKENLAGNLRLIYTYEKIKGNDNRVYESVQLSEAPFKAFVIKNPHKMSIRKTGWKEEGLVILDNDGKVYKYDIEDIRQQVKKDMEKYECEVEDINIDGYNGFSEIFYAQGKNKHLDSDFILKKDAYNNLQIIYMPIEIDKEIVNLQSEKTINHQT